MSILKTIKDVMFRRRRELGEQADGFRAAGKFIDAAIADARESEIRFAINTIMDYEAFFSGDEARTDRQESFIDPKSHVPHWCRTARTDNPDPHTYSWDGHWYLVRGNYKIDIDELFNRLPKDDLV